MYVYVDVVYVDVVYVDVYLCVCRCCIYVHVDVYVDVAYGYR